MSDSPKVDKEAVLSFLADQSVAKERIASSAEVELEKILSQSPDDAAYYSAVLKMAVAKAMRKAFEKVAEHVLSLEEF